MSSCFCWVYLKIRSNQDLDKTRKAMLDALEENIKNGVINSNNLEVITFYEECFGERPFDDDEILTCEENRWSRISECINELFDALTSEYDVGSIYHYGWYIYFTGGWSGGDDPTDSYKWIRNSSFLPKCILKAGCIRF